MATSSASLGLVGVSNRRTLEDADIARQQAKYEAEIAKIEKEQAKHDKNANHWVNKYLKPILGRGAQGAVAGAIGSAYFGPVGGAVGSILGGISGMAHEAVLDKVSGAGDTGQDDPGLDVQLRASQYALAALAQRKSQREGLNRGVGVGQPLTASGPAVLGQYSSGSNYGADMSETYVASLDDGSSLDDEPSMNLADYLEE